jgi:spore maturation protein CgeB
MTVTSKEARAEVKTILIAGPPFRGYLDMIAAGFKASGTEPSILRWDYPKRTMPQEIMFYSSHNYRLRLADAQDKANALALERAVQETKPNYVLVMKAVELTDRTREFCKNAGTKVVLWAYDSATEFPIITRVAHKYDLVYTYEPADLDILSKSCAPQFLPMAYDPKYYFRHDASGGKDIDVCFVGAIDRYPKRKKLLAHVANRFRDKTVAIWTDSIHWYSHRRIGDFLLAGPRRNIQLNRRTLEHGEVNDIYNRSKVCLNVHHIQSKKAVNPRTFEILGSGGLLLTDRKLDGIEGFEEGEGYIYYSNEVELIDKLRNALEDEQESAYIADIGHSVVRAHTFEQRARKILSDLS